MRKVNIWETDLEVEINEKDIFESDQYEKNVLINGMWLAYDEAVNAWIRIGSEAQYWDEHTVNYQS